MEQFSGTPTNSSGLKIAGELQLLKQRAQYVSQRLERVRQKIESQITADRHKTEAVVDDEECTGCGLCYEVCPVGAISVDGSAKIDATKCTACLACVQQCPQGAIAIKYPSKWNLFSRNVY